ncbi:MAG: zinc-ribbon domain-containing protein [Myxococcota bacterium]|jgi:predicted Zn finger-like uncharacterized protein|nr:zinc-ribbon domain-containing protein [Myxococcota bacterium]
MIAACPKCQTRYRVEPERIGPDGARLRCTQCSSVFRVRKPEAPGVAAPVAPTPRQEPALEAPVHRVVTSGAEAHASEIASSDFARSEPKASEAHEAVAGDGNQAGSAESRFGGASNRTQPAPNPEEPAFDHARLVLVAHPNADACKRIAEALEREGLQVLVAHDGVEAILSIQRALPRVVVLDAALPKMFGFQVCELVKRNESLRRIHVCMMGAIHRDDRYRRAPNEIYGADFYLEPPALPGALLEWLARLDLPLHSRTKPSGPSAPRPEPAFEAPAPRSVTSGATAHREVTSGAKAHASEIASSDFARSEAKPSEAHQARGGAGNEPLSAEGRFGGVGNQGPTVAPAPKPAADPLAAERAQAERLARIIVSDIVLYNEEKFAAAVRTGDLESLQGELAEGRALFRERIDASVREERDYLADELARVARSRGMP